MPDIVSYRGLDKKELAILVLDFTKPKESYLCLESIRKHVKVPHKIYFLSNGTPISSDYPYRYFVDGLIDYLMWSKKGSGCGCGIQELYRICDTPYAVLMQNDQIWYRDFEEGEFLYITSLLGDKYKCIGLAGDLNQGKYSERASICKTEDYLAIPNKPPGGPGIYDRSQMWTEEHVGNQGEKFKFGVYPKPFVADLGKYTVREFPDSAVLKWRTDTGELTVVNPPTQHHPEYKDFLPEEWDDMINGKWEPGRIPQKWQQNSFDFWSKHPVAKDL